MKSEGSTSSTASSRKGTPSSSPEHHITVAAEADWILDIGPEAGDAGGQLIAQGPPEKIAKSKTSRTAPFFKIVLGI